MAVAVSCTVDALESAARCYSRFSSKEKQAAKINYLVYALLAMGGQDFTNIDDLIDAIACFRCKQESVLDAFDAVIARNEEIKQGGVPADYSTYNDEADAVKTAIKCLMCLSDQDLRIAETVLRCQLSQTVT